MAAVNSPMNSPIELPGGDSPPPRKLSRETRRVQLIEATLEVLAERGFSRTTQAEVAKKAGLSHGLVNFHFQTKDQLLTETLAYLSDEYRENWTQALAAAGQGAADQLDALIRADFTPSICTPTRLAAWVSFWGEAQSRPLYHDKCGPNDEAYAARMESICGRLIEEGGYGRSPQRTARVIRVTSEGVWLDLIAQRHPYPPEEALMTVFTAASGFFPAHFTEKGLIRPRLAQPRQSGN